MPVDVAAGLAHLAAAPPLCPIGAADWVDLIARVQALALRWHDQTRACGWPPLSLYGLHPRAPFARLSATGALFLAARCHHHVLEVAPDAITVVTRAGSRLRIFRSRPDPDSVLAWTLCRPG